MTETRPLVAIQLTAGEKMLALRALRSAAAPHRARRWLDADTLHIDQAVSLAELLDRGARTFRPLSYNRRHAHQLAHRYRNAAYVAANNLWPGAPEPYFPVHSISPKG